MILRGDIQRREQRRRAVANVVVRLSSRDARAHRQQGTRAIQGLDLTLFVEAEHQRVIRRIEIQPDDVADLLHKLRIRRELERVDPMRLQTKRAPDARDGRFRETRDVRHAARGPLGRVRRGRFQRAGDDVHKDIVGHFARHPGPRFIGQAFQATDAKAFAPFADTIARDVQRPGHRAIRLTGGAAQHDARAQGQPLRRFRAPGPLLQRAPFVVRQQQRLVVTFSLHPRQGTPGASKVQGFFRDTTLEAVS